MNKDAEEKKFDSIVDLIGESWRLNRFTKNLAEKTDNPKIQKRAFNQINRFEKCIQSALETHNLNIIDFTGAPYETGLPILPINLGDFNAEDKLMIEMMMEPTIKIADTAEILRKGAAVLKKVTSQT